MKLGDKWEPSKGMENLVFTSFLGRPLWRESVSKFIREVIDSMNKEEGAVAERGIPPKVVQE